MDWHKVLFASQIRKGPSHSSQKTYLENGYGSIAVHVVDSDLPPTAPIIFTCPGVAGHFENDYIKNFVQYIKQANKYRIVVWNWPGCGDSPMTNRIITFGETRDLDIAISSISNSYPESPIFAVGFSAGANLLLRYMGEKGENTPVVGAVALACGYDAVKGVETLTNPLVLWGITKKLTETFQKNMDQFSNMAHLHAPSILACRSLKEWDKHFTCKLLGIEAEEYYKSHSSHVHLENIRKPVLLINAEDDPVVHTELLNYPKTAAQQNPNLILVKTKFGGHLGWLQGGIFKCNKATWGEIVILEFIEGIQNVECDDQILYIN